MKRRFALQVRDYAGGVTILDQNTSHVLGRFPTCSHRGDCTFYEYPCNHFCMERGQPAFGVTPFYRMVP